MAGIKFHKVPELFPNRKVRTVRPELLWARLHPTNTDMACVHPRVNTIVECGYSLGMAYGAMCTVYIFEQTVWPR